MGVIRLIMASQHFVWLCVAVLLALPSSHAAQEAQQEICSKTLRTFYIHIASGSECRGSTCSADCQSLIDTSIDTCVGMFVPNTRVEFNPHGIEQMRAAVNLDEPSECDWTCYACNHQGSANRRLSSYENRQSLNAVRQAARQSSSGLEEAMPAAEDSWTAPSALKTPLHDSTKPSEAVPNVEGTKPKEPAAPVLDSEGQKEPNAAIHMEGCSDTMDSCPQWASEGECASNEPFMVIRCCQSCLKHSQEIGDDTCKDGHPECATWASDGECATNAAFMLHACCDSCVKKLQTALNEGVKGAAESASDL